MIRRFLNMTYQKKILIICLVVSLLPTMILGIFCHSQVKTMLTEREQQNLTNTLSQENLRISSKLNEYENIANYVIWNTEVLHILNGKYETNYEMYLAYASALQPFNDTLRYLYPDISQLTIYSNLKIYYRLFVLEPLSALSHYDWYEEACTTRDPIWAYSTEDTSLSLINRFYDIPKDQTSLLQIKLDYGQLFSTLSALFPDHYGAVVLDRNGLPIYTYNTPDMGTDLPTANQLFRHIIHSECLSSYIAESSLISGSDWTLCIYRPLNTINESVQVITAAIIGIIFLCLTLVFLISHWLSGMIVRPLKQLSAGMRQVEKGNYQVSFTYVSEDEVGQLQKNFEHMVQQLDHLINETLKAKVTQTKLELKSLQAQINPHFFYNALSLINSKAIIAGQQDIEQMTQYLSTFYRTSLNKGKERISVSDELENIRSYIDIQLMMHSHSFEVSYDLDETIFDCYMPNLMLQPLVENAIKHGIDHITDPNVQGHLNISAKSNGELLVFTISDNGPGISEKKLTEILTQSSDGYGVNNVHTRAKLTYGAQYGLTYKSTAGKGTEAILVIPKDYTPTM